MRYFYMNMYEKETNALENLIAGSRAVYAIIDNGGTRGWNICG